MSKLFNKLKERSEELGISPESLKAAIDKANGDMGKILKFLTEQKQEPLPTDKFVSDRLIKPPPKPSKMSMFATSDTNTGEVWQTVPTTKRVLQKRYIPQKEGQELQSKLASIKRGMATERDEPFLFPNTEFDFDMQDAVKTSIKNFKKAKNKWNPDSSSIRRTL